MKISIVILFFSLFSFQSFANENITNHVEKLFGMGFVVESFTKSECNVYLQAEQLKTLNEFTKTLRLLELELAEKYPLKLKKVMEPNSETRVKAAHLHENRINKLKKESRNDAFSCGVMFGAILSERVKFEGLKIDLRLLLNK